MRVRNISNAKELLKEYKEYVVEPQLLKEQWHTYFKNQNPIHMEIGMGKGQFIRTLAKMNPNINYIGLEKVEELVLKSVRSIEAEEIRNISLINWNALKLEDILGEGEVERIYLNFSDPWPKARHDKRRLTHHGFLNIYQKLLKEHGEIHLKTDSRDLFEFSLEQFNQKQFTLVEVIEDLYGSTYKEMAKTEYEEKFIAEGKPIYKCIARIE